MALRLKKTSSGLPTSIFRTLTSAVGIARIWASKIPARVVEHFPIFGRRSTAKRRAVVVGPYARQASLFARLLAVVAVPLGILLCVIYGFLFGLTAPYLIVPFAIPIAILTAMIIWALPEQQTVPTIQIELLFAAFIVSKIVWPSYLAITLPGMPWITVLRIVGLPLLAFFLISLSVSKKFRTLTLQSVTAVRIIWIFALGFLFVQIITTLFSPSPFASIQGIFDQNIDTLLIFVLSCVIFRKNVMPERYICLLCALSVFIVALTMIENSEQHVIWAAHVPDFLHPPSPSVEVSLKSSFRLYTNIYRAKATFSTPLGLAEFISLNTALFLYFALSTTKPIWRAFCLFMVPMTFVAVRMTDARLGVVGVFGSVLLYGMLWSIARWRSRPGDLLASATVYAYPVIFVGALATIFVSNRLKTMVLGGGAQAGSTAARSSQLEMASHAFWRQPWGYGAGQSGNKMGFAKDAFVTIDNYFISIQLDYGILGIIFWYGTFLAGIVFSTYYCLSDKYAKRHEAKLLAPLAVILSMFLVVKWVHGQDDNHTFYYLILGMISALIYRLRNSATPSSAEGASPGAS